MSIMIDGEFVHMDELREFADDLGFAHVSDRTLQNYVDWSGDAELEYFDDRFMGEWNGDDEIDAIANWIYDCELVDVSGIPENLRMYFDYKAYARDMRLGGEVYADSCGIGEFSIFLTR